MTDASATASNRVSSLSASAAGAGDLPAYEKAGAGARQRPEPRPSRHRVHHGGTTLPGSMRAHDKLLVTWLPIGDLTPYDGNPRTITDTAITKVAASIKTFGWRQPIVVDEANVIVAGHTRFLAAKRLKLKQVPVHVASGLTDDELRAHRQGRRPNPEHRSGEAQGSER